MNISHLVMPGISPALARIASSQYLHELSSNYSNQGTKEFSEKQHTAFASLKL
jgi:hypothetical protein